MMDRTDGDREKKGKIVFVSSHVSLPLIASIIINRERLTIENRNSHVGRNCHVDAAADDFPASIFSDTTIARRNMLRCRNKQYFGLEYYMRTLHDHNLNAYAAIILDWQTNPADLIGFTAEIAP